MADIKKFLDQSGVSTLWGVIASELEKKAAANDVYTKQEVDDKIAAVPTYNDTEVRDLISDNADAIAVLNGDSSQVGSVAYQIAAIVAGADADFDTLKEIADWIANHPDSVSALQSQITDNKNAAATNAGAIADLEALVGTSAVAIQIADAIANAGHASATDLAAAIGRIETLESWKTSHATEFTNLKNKVDTLQDSYEEITATGGQPNVIETIQVNGVAKSVVEKTVNLLSSDFVTALTAEEIKAACNVTT